MSAELDKLREVVRPWEEKEKQNKIELFYLHKGETFFIGDTEFDIWFKLKCYYNAKTELFDRTLTDLRSPHDPTEAYISPEIRRLSDSNAMWIYKYICRIADRFHIPHHSDLLKSYGATISAQGWIDLYNFLLENGEMDFMNCDK